MGSLVTVRKPSLEIPRQVKPRKLSAQHRDSNRQLKPAQSMADSQISNLYDFKKTMRINTIRNTPFTWKAQSLDFDLLRTKIFRVQRKKTKAVDVMMWTAYGLIGIFTGLTCACMMGMEEFLVHEKRLVTDQLIDGESN